MYIRILIATLALFWRTFTFPFYVVRNFVILRKHRLTYKKLNNYGNIRFSEESPELVEKRSRLVQDSFARSFGRYSDCSTS